MFFLISVVFAVIVFQCIQCFIFKSARAFNLGNKMGGHLLLKQEIVDVNLQVKAIIQDILGFRGSLNELEILNEIGRSKISQLRKCIEKLDEWAKDENDPKLKEEVDSQFQILERTLQAFRKANISTMLEIEKSDRSELFTMAPESEMRQRSTTGLISQQETITERMLSISRHLAETTQKSATTLDTLIQSSEEVGNTNEELLSTAGSIHQSGKLLNKYGRRESTDKILLFFAFIFFLACVFYIIQKRLF